MQQVIINILILLSVLGIIGICTYIRIFIRNKRTKQRPGNLVRFISVVLLTVTIAVGSLYWLIDCYFIENVPYQFTIEKAIEEYRGVGNYVILERIDSEFISDKILLVQENEDVLVAYHIITRKMLVGLEKYYAKGEAYLISSSIYGSDLIAETHDSDGIILSPNFWYGIVFPENRDKIRVNGKVPYLHDIHFSGSDYVVWYIKIDAS